MQPESTGRHFLTGLALDELDQALLIDLLIEYAASVGKKTIAYLNIHVANIAAENDDLKRFINNCCDLVYCDGRGIELGAKLSGIPGVTRTTAADWLPDVLRKFQKEGLKVYAVAGKPGVVERAVNAINAGSEHPVEVRAHHGYLDEKNTSHVIEDINRFAPNILIVGMGTPVQELWVLKNRAAIEVPLVWVVGAAFDYFAHEQARGPMVLRQAGHEWLARLWTDPRRLWKRYLVGNPTFLARVIASRISRK